MVYGPPTATACQLPQSLPTARQLANSLFSSLPPNSLLPFADHISLVVIRRGKDRPQEFSDTHQPQGVLQPPRRRLRKLPRRLLHQSKQRQTARQRKPTSVRSHRQSPAMNAATASFLGLRRRQRGQDLFREAPRKAPRKALRRAPASQCARASQSAIRIATIAFVHVNCTAQSRVTHTLHCPSIASKSGGWGGFGDVCPGGPRRRWRECQYRPPHSPHNRVLWIP